MSGAIATSPFGWMRVNLFSTPLNSALTVLILPGFWLMRAVPSIATMYAVVMLLAGLLLSACGAEQKTTFTNANWGDIQFSAASGDYDGSPVDVTGPVFLVDNQQDDGVWFAIYADAGQSFRVLVRYSNAGFRVMENQVVHVTGTIEQATPTPGMIMWEDGPVVDARTATIVSG